MDAQNLRTRDPQARRPTTPIGARGETASSKTQEMTYPYCVGILEPSPPTIYHGQGLASPSGYQAVTLAHTEGAVPPVVEPGDLEKNQTCMVRVCQ